MPSQNQALGDRTGRQKLTGAGLNIAPLEFEAITCALPVWSKMRWSSGEISSGKIHWSLKCCPSACWQELCSCSDWTGSAFDLTRPVKLSFINTCKLNFKRGSFTPASCFLTSVSLVFQHPERELYLQPLLRWWAEPQSSGRPLWSPVIPEAETGGVFSSCSACCFPF